MKLSIIVLYLITIIVICFILFLVFFKSDVDTININKLSKPHRLETHWWGYGWRPWWKQYR